MNKPFFNTSTFASNKKAKIPPTIFLSLVLTSSLMMSSSTTFAFKGLNEGKDYLASTHHVPFNREQTVHGRAIQDPLNGFEGRNSLQDRVNHEYFTDERPYEYMNKTGQPLIINPLPSAFSQLLSSVSSTIGHFLGFIHEKTHIGPQGVSAQVLPTPIDKPPKLQPLSKITQTPNNWLSPKKDNDSFIITFAKTNQEGKPIQTTPFPRLGVSNNKDRQEKFTPDIYDEYLKKIIKSGIPDNNIKLWNVGQGNCITVKSGYGTFSIRWIIDAGSSANPFLLTGKTGENLSIEQIKSDSYTKMQNLGNILEQVNKEFCPQSHVTDSGIIFISHLDADHVNKIYDVVNTCYSKGENKAFKELIKGSLGDFSEYWLASFAWRNTFFYDNGIAKQISHCLKNIPGGMVPEECGGAAHLIDTKMGESEDKFSSQWAPKFNGCLLGYKKNSYQFFKDKCDNPDLLEKFGKWIFGKELLNWIAPTSYFSPTYANVNKLSSPPYVNGYKSLADYLDKGNRIPIELFMKIQSQEPSPEFFILNNPKYDENVGKNENNVMIGLRSLLESRVYVLGDQELPAFMETFYFDYMRLVDKNPTNFKTRLKSKAVIAAHHGAVTHGSHLLLGFFEPDAIYFSAGVRSDYGHPNQKAIEFAEKTATSSTFFLHPIYYYDDDTQKWTIKDTKKYVYVTAKKESFPEIYYYGL